MKIKNDHKKNSKVKITQPLREKHSMEYLVLSREQICKVRNNMMIRYEKVKQRINQKGDSQNIKTDQIVKQFEQLQKQAKNHDFNDLQKKIVIGLGKRILFLEIQNRKLEIQKKKQKKQEIQESFFRYKKIRKFDYQNLIKDKLKKNSYLARPYYTGKGFVESDISYNQCDDIHHDRLQQCQFLHVIKQINKIYMNNFSSSAEKSNNFYKESIIKIVFILCFILLVLGFLMIRLDNQIIQYMLLSDLLLIMLVISVLGIKTYIDKPNNYNQLQQTKHDVHEYFQRINKQNRQKNKKFQWICPDNFMYIQVHFNVQ